jgi:NTP pyrophosphatase (non-canonical NTP hydrolase)
MDIKKIQNILDVFASDRDWDQFHSPKNLAMAIAVETGELLELFQWLTEEQSKKLPDNKKHRVAEEMADVMIYLLRLADKTNIDINKAVLSKIELNADKYPVAKAKGNAKKYTELDE